MSQRDFAAMTRPASADRTATNSRNPSRFQEQCIRWAIYALPLMALAVIPFCIASLSTAVSDLHAHPGFDLRPKVVGARAVAASLDPYNLDAAGRVNEYFKSTTTPLYTPALLMLYVPLSSLAFDTQREIYFWLDWVFAACAFYLLMRCLNVDRHRTYLSWIIFATFILCSYAFRIHLERGQYYVLLLLLTCYLAAALRNNWTSWLSCLPVALLLVLRPTYGLILVFALICMEWKKWVFRVAVLSATMFLLTLPEVGLHGWLEFVRVAELRQSGYVTQILMMCERPLTSTAAQTADSVPFVIEHIDFSNPLPHPAINGTFIGLVSWVTDAVAKWHRLPLAACKLMQLTSAGNSACILMVLAGGAWVAWLAGKRKVSRNVLIACMLLWPMILEIFGPERFLYTAVLEVLPFTLLTINATLCNGICARGLTFYGLIAFLVLGLVPTVLFQIGNLGFVKQTLDSALILVALPGAMAVTGVGAVLSSSKRIYSTNTTV